MSNIPPSKNGVNPALCLADYLDTQTDWSPNWTSVDAAADYCEEDITPLTDPTNRWEIGLTVTRGKVNDWRLQHQMK